METASRRFTQQEFSEALFERIKAIEAAAGSMAFYEFCYALENLYPINGWESVELDATEEIERRINHRAFFELVEVRSRDKDRIVLDESILNLTRMLCAGLVRGEYNVIWVKNHFYFDVRGFFFLPRTIYFTEEVLKHFGGKPYQSFEPRQKRFENQQDVGYLDFQEANAEIDQAFIKSIQKLITTMGTPILITLAGPTAAGKTEITQRLLDTFQKMGKKSSTIEMDNFLIDKSLRENKPMGKETTHFSLFKSSLREILSGKRITIPRYDFIYTTSSHDPQGNLRSGCTPLVIEPADIIFLEGNFPFQMDEIADLIGLKIVYLTDDPIRLKRKWKRDIDYRKKYDPTYFRNRFFKTQFMRAEDIYRPLMGICEMVVDTTGAALWVIPKITDLLDRTQAEGN